MGLDNASIGIPIEELDVSECWGSDYKRDYYVFSIDTGTGATPLEEEGNSGDCQFGAGAS